jgi:hypothetical protein
MAADVSQSLSRAKIPATCLVTVRGYRSVAYQYYTSVTLPSLLSIEIL